MNSKVVIVVEGEFGATEEGGSHDVFKVMDYFHTKGIEVHGYEEGIYHAVVCE